MASSLSPLLPAQKKAIWRHKKRKAEIKAEIVDANLAHMMPGAQDQLFDLNEEELLNLIKISKKLIRFKKKEAELVEKKVYRPESECSYDQELYASLDGFRFTTGDETREELHTRIIREHPELFVDKLTYEAQNAITKLIGRN